MAITMKEIAQLANVSIGTVDRVLNHRPGVSLKTKARVEEVCRQVNYSMNLAGKALVMQRMNTVVAVVINAPFNPFSKEVLRGVRSAAAEFDRYHIDFRFFYMDSRDELEALRILNEVQSLPDLKGIIIKPVNSESVALHLQALHDRGVAVATCTSDISNIEKLCFAGQDHIREGRLAAAMLATIRREPLSIGIITNPLNILARQQKIDGFTTCLKDKNRKFELLFIKELGKHDDVFSETVQALTNNPINALFISASIEPISRALKQTLKDRSAVTAFAFGAKAEFAPYLVNGTLDYVITEDPYRQGYCAVERVITSILGAQANEEMQAIGSEILIDENAR